MEPSKANINNLDVQGVRISAALGQQGRLFWLPSDAPKRFTRISLLVRQFWDCVRAWCGDVFIDIYCSLCQKVIRHNRSMIMVEPCTAKSANTYDIGWSVPCHVAHESCFTHWLTENPATRQPLCVSKNHSTTPPSHPCFESYMMFGQRPFYHQAVCDPYICGTPAGAPGTIGFHSHPAQDTEDFFRTVSNCVARTGWAPTCAECKRDILPSVALQCTACVLICGHIFHDACAELYIGRNRCHCCPVCRFVNPSFSVFDFHIGSLVWSCMRPSVKRQVKWVGAIMDPMPSLMSGCTSQVNIQVDMLKTAAFLSVLNQTRAAIRSAAGNAVSSLSSLSSLPPPAALVSPAYNSGSVLNSSSGLWPLPVAALHVGDSLLQPSCVLRLLDQSFDSVPQMVMFLSLHRRLTLLHLFCTRCSLCREEFQFEKQTNRLTVYFGLCRHVFHPSCLAVYFSQFCQRSTANLPPKCPCCDSRQSEFPCMSWNKVQTTRMPVTNRFGRSPFAVLLNSASVPECPISDTLWLQVHIMSNIPPIFLNESDMISTGNRARQVTDATCYPAFVLHSVSSLPAPAPVLTPTPAPETPLTTSTTPMLPSSTFLTPLTPIAPPPAPTLRSTSSTETAIASMTPNTTTLSTKLSALMDALSASDSEDKTERGTNLLSCISQRSSFNTLSTTRPKHRRMQSHKERHELLLLHFSKLSQSLSNPNKFRLGPLPTRVRDVIRVPRR
jgi:hypothetical protein